MKPVKVERLHCPTTLCFALVTPKFEAPTAKMRAVLPKQIPMKDFIHNCCMAGLMVKDVTNVYHHQQQMSLVYAVERHS